MEPVLEVVASVFLLRNPVTNHKHVFILFASVLTQYSRAAILPGFLSSRQEKCFHQGKWEHSFHLVGQRTRLHCSPRVLGFNIPDLSAQTREAQGPLHRHTVVGCAALYFSTCRWLWQVIHLYHNSNTTLLWIWFTTKECSACTRAKLKRLSPEKRWHRDRIVSAPGLNRNHPSWKWGCVWFSQSCEVHAGKTSFCRQAVSQWNHTASLHPCSVH